MRTEWLVKAPKTPSDHACPHGVQFYDVVIDGARHARAAWVYQAPSRGCSKWPAASGSGKNVQVG